VQGNVAERVHRIMEERKHAYDFADVTIDSTNTPAAEIVDQIMRRMQ
jgi:shikimate kinase